jgi:hypothetical protein
MSTIILAIFAIVGLILYLYAAPPKISEVGRIMFWTALLAFFLTGGIDHTFHAIHR